jgi:3-oxosteroid 1-dehydrogenase
MSKPDGDLTYDLVIVGSGAGGMVTALRAHDLGLSAVVIEKTHYYGGTSATSGGGTWIPMNDAIAAEDSAETAMTYLRAVTKGEVREELLGAYVEDGQPMTCYLETLGVKSFSVPGYPDYYSELPGIVLGRAMLPYDLDGAILGEEFFRLREHHPFLLAFNRYAMNFVMSAKLSTRQPGWQWIALKMLKDYWLDIPWRLKTRRDRRLTMGRALIGGLRKAMMDRGIPLLLNTSLTGLEKSGSRVMTALCSRHGHPVRIHANEAIILASGGYEHNQEMRDRYMEVPTTIEATLTPKAGNTGDAIRIGQEVGAQLENMDKAWWSPSVRFPSRESPNVVVAYQLFFERGRPGALMVNRLGKRFVDEAVSYDQFGLAMIEDQKKTGANTPCWMIFDAGYRSRHPAAALMPSWVMPDSSLPQEWWDSVIYRASSIPELARKIGVEVQALESTVGAMNRYARTGIDEEFGRGSTRYDQFFGEAGRTPNSCLGALDTPPFYALQVELGDIGTKGGLKIDVDARVLDESDRPIPGLYAIGNTTGSVFGGYYPGAGVTLGQAMIFGYRAANHIARRNASGQVGEPVPGSPLRVVSGG